MDPKSIIEIMAGATMLMAPALVIIRTIWQQKGLGMRAIQLASVCMIVPVILILALERILESSTLGTLIGGLIGYALSGIGARREDGRNPTP